MRLLTLVALSAVLTAVAGATLNTQARGGAAGDQNPEQIFSFEQEPMPSKMSWPELVGKPSADVKKQLEEELPGKQVILVPEHSMMTMDFRMDRVRVIYSRETGLVVSPPRIG